jgi:hypothetical protein
MEEKREVRRIVFILFVVIATVYVLTASGTNFHNTKASILGLEVVRGIVERQDLSVTEGNTLGSASAPRPWRPAACGYPFR